MEYLQLSLTILCTALFFLWNYKYIRLNNNEEIFKVSTVDNKAYWVYNNILYTSEVIDGKKNMRKKKKVDSMGMSENDIHDLLNTIGQE